MANKTINNEVNEKNMENENANNETVVDVKESKIKGLVSKAGKGLKKHGKKIAVGAAVVIGGAVIYMLTKGGSDVQDIYLVDTDVAGDVLDDVIQTATEVIENAEEVVSF